MTSIFYYRRLKTLIDENEKTKKHEEQLFAIKNRILGKIDVINNLSFSKINQIFLSVHL